ncbi:MAG TPA: hypothetical protein VGK18_11540 [Propionicimonas sp.]|uniref:hypothetical protein n=1 Tax=Propionicimonas sp. TaxID=1955623 RepID=UPI002F419BCF
MAAVGSRGRTTRTIQVGERAGAEFPVVAPSHVSAIATFAGGGVAQSLLSFDSPLARMGIIEITGTEGTLVVPDPNFFGGVVRITRPVTMATIAEDPVWTTLPAPEATWGRGAGVLDLARCIRGGGTPVASGALGYHVLDTMVAMQESLAGGQTVAVTSSIAPVPLLPEGWDPYEATLG